MSKSKKSFILFILIQVLFLIIFSTLYAQNNDDLVLTCLMFTPMLSVILMRLITQERGNHLYLRFQIKKYWKSYAFCYLATPLIAYFGAIVYFICFPMQFDPIHSSYALSLGTIGNDYYQQLGVILPLAMLLNPLGALLSCFGEEFAWRGYVLPTLSKKFTPLQATFITNLLWGLWHAPIILMGFNYGHDYPLLGVFAMLCFTQVIGLITSFLFYKTKNIGCSVVFHASLNALDRYAPSVLFMSQAANPFIGPNLIGIIGGLGFILLGIYSYHAIQNRLPS